MKRGKAGHHWYDDELEQELAKAAARMDATGRYPPSRLATRPIDDRQPEQPAEAPDPRPPRFRRRRALRVAVPLIALVITGCTQAQLDTFQQQTGVTFDQPTIDNLLNAPDAPMPLGDGRMITTDGQIEMPLRSGHCDQWRAVAIAAGWTPTEFDAWASRIIWRESHCDPGARSRTRDSGLFQINDINLVDMRQRPALWAEAIDKLGGVPSQADLYDPYTNAVVAEALFDIRGSAPWS